MPELRRDPVTGRWVIISTDRQKRPHDFHFERATAMGRDRCPFCAGREAMTPSEVLAYRPGGGAPNTAGWDVRVVPNKFPALQVEGTLDREGDGMFDRMSGIGAHEVIIETPDHDRPLALQSEIEIERWLWAARERILERRPRSCPTSCARSWKGRAGTSRSRSAVSSATSSTRSGATSGG